KMKKLLSILLTVISGFTCYSQILYEKGYFINNPDERIECQIRNLDWDKSTTEFEYRFSENEKPVKATMASVKEFGIYTVSKYVRETVSIDRSSENANNLSHSKPPYLKKKHFF